jgi:Polyketide cyclase / dehydrase and lipid transport
VRIVAISTAAATVLIPTGAAFALDSNVTVTSPMSPDALWKKVGDFCGVGDWHPAIEKCALIADDKQRTLALTGGGALVEALESVDNANHTYTYTILSGPLPVTNYHSTISVSPIPKVRR